MNVTLDHIEPITQNIKTFWFNPERPIRYQAGQFIELFIPHDNPDSRGIKHWFTLSSSPSESPLIAITTKFADENGSSFKRALSVLKPGDKLRISDPMGDFVLPKDKSRPLLFAAGGIGITPFRSIIKSLVDSGEQRDVVIVYSARHEDELAFTELLEQSKLRVNYIISQPADDWNGLTGNLSPEQISTLVPDADKRIIYMSGPEPMVESLVEAFKSQGVPEHRLVGDYFPNYPA